MFFNNIMVLSLGLLVYLVGAKIKIINVCIIFIYYKLIHMNYLHRLFTQSIDLVSNQTEIHKKLSALLPQQS